MSKESGDLIVRWYNMGSGQAQLRLVPSFGIKTIYKSDVLERRYEKLAGNQHLIEGYKIVTYAYQF
ncbi:glycosyl hydrolase-related protein [Paenibacillus larvae]